MNENQRRQYDDEIERKIAEDEMRREMLVAKIAAHNLVLAARSARIATTRKNIDEVLTGEFKIAQRRLDSATPPLDVVGKNGNSAQHLTPQVAARAEAMKLMKREKTERRGSNEDGGVKNSVIQAAKRFKNLGSQPQASLEK